MVQAIRNNKGQFFIVAAVIIIASMAVVHYNFTSVSYSQLPTISSDAGFYFQSIENECGNAVLAMLGKASANQSLLPAQIDAMTDSNLTYFENYVEDISARKGMLVDVNHSINPGTTPNNINVDFNISLRTESEHYKISDYNVNRSININIFPPIVFAPFCVFQFDARMDGGQPIRNLSATNLNPPGVVWFNNTIPLGNCFVYEVTTGTPGRYATLCMAGGGCPAPILMVDLTDHRGVRGVGTLP